MRFVVVRRPENPSHTPTLKTNSPTFLHDSMESAKVEAKRLASFNPGVYFDVYELIPIGTATTQAVIWQTAQEVRYSDPIP